MIPFIATVLTDIAVGLIAISKRNNPAALALAMFVFSLALWQTELFLLTVIEDQNTLNLWFHLTRIGMFLAPCFLALLTWQICAGKSEKFLKFVLFPIFAVATTLSLLNNTILPSAIFPADTGYLPKPDAIYYIFLLMFLYALLSSILFGVLSYKKAPQRRKRRIKWMLISLALIILFSGASIYIFIAVREPYLLKIVSAFSNAVFVGILLYSVINHHLADVGSAVSVLLARVVVLGSLIASFFIGLDFIDQYVPNSNISNMLLKFGMSIVMLEFYPLFLRLVSPGTRRLLATGKYDFYTVTRDIQYAFNRSVEVIDLQNVLDHLLLKIMQLSRYRVCIVCQKNETQILNIRALGSKDSGITLNPKILEQLKQDEPRFIMQDEADKELQALISKHEGIACTPLFFQSQLIGVLFVGPSKNYHSRYFRHDDIRVFQWLMKELPAELSRIVLHDAVLEDLGKAQKMMSLIELMNQYHHDIKAPLSIIDGVVSNDLYDRKKQQQVILEQVKRGSQLITMMSNVLRGQRERQTQPVDLKTLIENCVTLFERDIDSVHFEIDDISKVVGDSNDLKILFINLIKNSVEAKKPAGLLKINVSGGEDKDAVWISFKDNGCGMSKEQVDTLWDRNRSNKSTGSGVGIQAIKRIADEHGAFIKVVSKPDVGTEFKLHFPMRVQLAQSLVEHIESERL